MGSHRPRDGAAAPDGFSAHLVVDPGTGLFKATRLTAAAGGPAATPPVSLALLTEYPMLPGPVEVLADSAYGTGAALAAPAEAGHRPRLEPWPLRPAVADRSTATTSAAGATSLWHLGC